MTESDKPFKVVTTSIIPFRLDFRYDIVHSLMSRSHTVNVCVALDSDSGFRGYGESVPRDYVTGENSESVITFLESVLPSFTSSVFSSPEEVIEKVNNIGMSDLGLNNPAGMCALDLALLDLAGKHWDMPVSRLLGLPVHKKPLVYSLVVPLLSDKKLSAVIEWINSFEFKHVKIKVGAENPAGRVSKIKSMLGNGIDFRVDVNCSWNRSHAPEYMEKLADLDVVSVEQPLPPGAFEDTASLRKKGLPLITLDESVFRPDDVIRAARAGACDIVNVRISKCGGILGALRVVETSLKNRLGVQLGAHVGESCILSAAGAQLASVVPQFRWLEGCFGTHLLLNDLCQKPYRFEKGGRFTLPSGPGLGVTVSEERLREAGKSVKSRDHE